MTNMFQEDAKREGDWEVREHGARTLVIKTNLTINVVSTSSTVAGVVVGVGPLDKARAERLVRAVNAHGELIDALTALIEYEPVDRANLACHLGVVTSEHCFQCRRVAAARAALALARGEL